MIFFNFSACWGLLSRGGVGKEEGQPASREVGVEAGFEMNAIQMWSLNFIVRSLGCPSWVASFPAQAEPPARGCGRAVFEGCW